MRLLFISNYYPPFARGGYEQWCEEVAVELNKRGHEIAVLTAKVAEEPPNSEENGIVVLRRLNLEVIGGLWQTAVRLWRHRTHLEAENLDTIRQITADFQPDIAMIWGMWNVPRTVPALIEQLLPTQTVYFFCDYWPTLPSTYIQQLQNPSRTKLTQLPKKMVGRLFLPQLIDEQKVDLQFLHPFCVSQAVRDLLVEAGIAVAHAQIIYGGTHIDQFAGLLEKSPSDDKLKLLYVGRLSAEKDVMVAVKAMALLKEEPVSLDIVGSGDEDYEASLQALVADQDLAVRFHGRIPRDEIPAIMQLYDGLVFTSKWPEPFARTVLEAMAAGLTVIGTTTGGTGEILTEGVTGLTFPAGDAAALAHQVKVLVSKPLLRQQLAQNGQTRVRSCYSFNHMVNDIEAVLYHMADVDKSILQA